MARKRKIATSQLHLRAMNFLL